METDEGNHKNKRAGRRSVWWRFQAFKIDCRNGLLTQSNYKKKCCSGTSIQKTVLD